MGIKEFNLSEKIGIHNCKYKHEMLLKEDIKEFIKRFKGEFKAGNWQAWQIHKEIDKLAGDKLTWKNLI